MAKEELHDAHVRDRNRSLKKEMVGKGMDEARRVRNREAQEKQQARKRSEIRPDAQQVRGFSNISPEKKVTKQIEPKDIKWGNNIAPGKVLMSHGVLIRGLNKIAENEKLPVASICATAASKLQQVTSIDEAEIDAKLTRRGSVGGVATDLQSFVELTFDAYVLDKDTRKTNFQTVTIVLPQMCFLLCKNSLREVR